MRFPKETRALIHGSAPHPVTIPWPAGASEPQKGRVYWMQSAEDAEAEAKRRQESPDTCAEVLAGMHERHYGERPKRPKKRRRVSRAPLAGSERILVIDAEILDIGWEAKVALYENPDPVEHLRVKAKVPAGPNPMEGFQEPTELEPEQIPDPSPMVRRLEAEEAMRVAHKASVDYSEVMKTERHLLNQRRKGRPAKLAEEALKRAKKRHDEVSADDAA